MDFKETLHAIWADYIGNQNKHTDAQMTIENLAIVCEKLHEQNKTIEVTRKIPGFLSNRGAPNLIICPQIDQIPIVLSIYAHTVDCDLPSNDEVLYCTYETSNEDLEIFLRIALKSSGNKIYTLLNINDLSYSNTTVIDKCFQQYESTQLYNVVFVCTSEKQSQCLIASTFCKYKVKPIILSLGDLQAYLQRKISEKTTAIKKQGKSFIYGFELLLLTFMVTDNSLMPNQELTTFLKNL